MNSKPGPSTRPPFPQPAPQPKQYGGSLPPGGRMALRNRSADLPPLLFGQLHALESNLNEMLPKTRSQGHFSLPNAARPAQNIKMEPKPPSARKRDDEFRKQEQLQSIPLPSETSRGSKDMRSTDSDSYQALIDTANSLRAIIASNLLTFAHEKVLKQLCQNLDQVYSNNSTMNRLIDTFKNLKTKMGIIAEELRSLYKLVDYMKFEHQVALDGVKELFAKTRAAFENWQDIVSSRLQRITRSAPTTTILECIDLLESRNDTINRKNSVPINIRSNSVYSNLYGNSQDLGSFSSYEKKVSKLVSENFNLKLELAKKSFLKNEKILENNKAKGAIQTMECIVKLLNPTEELSPRNVFKKALAVSERSLPKYQNALANFWKVVTDKFLEFQEQKKQVEILELKVEDLMIENNKYVLKLLSAERRMKRRPVLTINDVFRLGNFDPDTPHLVMQIPL